MGILDTIESMAGQFGGSGGNAQAAGGLLESIREQPGGIGGVMQTMQQRGMGGAVQQWAGGETQPASPDQVEQSLGGTGLIDQVAAKTGMSPTMVKGAMAVLLPIVIHHFVSSGHVTAEGQPTGQPMPEQGGMLQSILSRLG